MAEKRTALQIQKMQFEEAFIELEQTVSLLETGRDKLEDAIENYEYGMRLKEHCEKLLNNAKLKIEKISNSNVKAKKNE